MAFRNSVARREYYVKNREKMLEMSKKYRDNNIEKVRASANAWRKKNPEKVREYNKIYSEKIWFKKKEEEWENTLIELGYGDLYRS